MPLTDKQVKAIQPREKPFRITDERSMYLEVMPNGSKYWRFKYRFNGKEKRLALGVYPDITLKKAREKRDEARTLLADGIDPSAHKKANMLAKRHSATNSFEAVAREWQDTHQKDKSKSHQQRITRCLEREGN